MWVIEVNGCSVEEVGDMYAYLRLSEGINIGVLDVKHLFAPSVHLPGHCSPEDVVENDCRRQRGNQEDRRLVSSFVPHHN